ncbi:MAG: hypothetical protein JWM74_3530 [Myxococcaceae bacterium]|nr:hypothetical protein [Myxococcaceae bacterium]
MRITVAAVGKRRRAVSLWSAASAEYANAAASNGTQGSHDSQCEREAHRLAGS